MESQEVKRVIECLLFVSDKPLSLSALRALLEPIDRRTLLEALDELKAEYDAQERAFHLVEIAEGYQLVTRVAYAPWIRKLYKSRVSNKLSRPALETLAIIAYRQPISKAEIEDIRGVSADGVVNSLLERKMVRIVGRKEVIGRPLLYGTTKEFLHYFGLKDLTDMPELKDLQEMLLQDEAGENWELNAQGQLITKAPGKEEVLDGEILETGEPNSNSEKKAEVVMEAHSETVTQNLNSIPGALAPLPEPVAPEDALSTAEAGQPQAGEKDETVNAGARRKSPDDYDEENLYYEKDDEKDEDDDEEDEDEDEDDEEDDEDEDEDDEEDDEDEDEDDEEDDEDEEEDDEEDDEDEEEDDEEDDEDDDDLDDLDEEDDEEDEEDEDPEEPEDPETDKLRRSSYYN